MQQSHTAQHNNGQSFNTRQRLSLGASQRPRAAALQGLWMPEPFILNPEAMLQLLYRRSWLPGAGAAIGMHKPGACQCQQKSVLW